jgi:hypothetical protein
MEILPEKESNGGLYQVFYFFKILIYLTNKEG